MEDDHLNASFKAKKNGFYIRQRYVLSVLGFFGLFTMSCTRNNLNLVIVTMVNTTEQNQTQSGTFNWDSKQQGLLLGSYFYGYAAGNIPGGWMAGKYGFRKVFGVSLLISAIFSVLTPPAAYANFYLAVMCRALLGLFQGGLYTAMTHAWSNWAPPLEVSILNSITFSGFIFGSVAIFPLSGVIAQYLFWEAVFYITGGVAIFSSILFSVLVSDAPSTHQCISEKEKLYIEKSLGKQGISKPNSIPWKSILTTKCTLALFVCHVADTWFQHTIPTILPTYLSNVLHYNMTQGGLVMILPFLVQGFVILFSSQVTDTLRRKQLVTTTNIRKINSGLSLSISGLCLILTGYIGVNHYVVIGLFTTSFAINGLSYPGHYSNALDFAPRHSGIIFGISNTIANIICFLGPFSAGYIVTDPHSIPQWQSFFWLTFGINITGAIVYVIFGSGKEQKWAKEEIGNQLAEIEEEKLELT
ncbi:unnamed protein product [Clavelina lepadiformis]|uniref:Major facilitator superfamily (MFS) profile domain-containing protein n=1 Tax=Clavelina lepadiformis TaxID=159417 RepID=A0ABP0EXJ0_CLALP